MVDRYGSLPLARLSPVPGQRERGGPVCSGRRGHSSCFAEPRPPVADRDVFTLGVASHPAGYEPRSAKYPGEPENRCRGRACEGDGVVLDRVPFPSKPRRPRDARRPDATCGLRPPPRKGLGWKEAVVRPSQGRAGARRGGRARAPRRSRRPHRSGPPCSGPRPPRGWPPSRRRSARPR